MQKLEHGKSLWHPGALDKVGLRTDAVSACAGDGTGKGHAVYFPERAVWAELVTEKKKQQETELKTRALLSAFILVNTLSDRNSCLSQTSSRAHPSKIPIETPALMANGGSCSPGDDQGKSWFAPGYLMYLHTQLRAGSGSGSEGLLSCASIRCSKDGPTAQGRTSALRSRLACHCCGC